MANNASQVTRRRFAAGLALGSVALALPFPAFALTLDQAKALIEKAIAEVNTTINSGKSESAFLNKAGPAQEFLNYDAEGWLRGFDIVSSAAIRPCSMTAFASSVSIGGSVAISRVTSSTSSGERRLRIVSYERSKSAPVRSILLM